LGEAIQQLGERVRPAIVQISARGFSAQDGASQSRVQVVSGVGSGVIVDPAGYIVTNAHVVGDARRVEVLIPRSKKELAAFRSSVKPPGKPSFAEVIGLDREADIAVLRVQQDGLPSLPFADSELVRQGDLVLAAGSPFGLENSLTMGVVSSVARQIRPDDPMIYIQTDASINPGNSGGPLLDADGSIVGINTMIASHSGGSEGVGFAVPSNIARTVYEQIRKHGRVRRGYVGVIAQTITPVIAEGLELDRDWGVIVADVASGSAAAAAGIEIKDIVLTLDGKPLENARQFGVNIYRHPGESVALELLRAGQKITRQVAVLERPKDPERLASLIQGDANQVPQLGVFAVDLDEKVTPILETTRKLSGAVVVMAAFSRSNGDAFLPGDVIYEVNGNRIKGLEDLKAAAASLTSGQAVVVHIERLGQLQFLAFRIE
jgi:serine protease Do